MLVYGSGGLSPEVDEMEWMDRTGKRLGAVGQPGSNVRAVAFAGREKSLVQHL